MITTNQVNAIAAEIEALGVDETTDYETHPCVSPFMAPILGRHPVGATRANRLSCRLVGPAAGRSNSLQANLSVLRQQYPSIHFTYCMDDDLPNNTPVIEHKEFNLYLVDGREHCLCLTNDYEVATGIVVAEVIAD